MAYRKKGASHYQRAITRLAALKSINPVMDLGNGLTITLYQDAVADLRNKIDDHNTALSLIDEKKNQVHASEKKLKDLSERMLAGVASQFGKDSDEYEKAGGVKKSERKRASRKTKPAA
jgi:hypothetical protein